MRRREVLRKRAHQNLAVAAEALAGGVLQQESLSYGVSGTLGSGNGRIKRAVVSILLQAAATGARRKQHSPLSVVAIGGSITSGRMLDSYCKDCVDEVKYRDVWSTHVERMINEGLKHRNEGRNGSAAIRVHSFGINGASICAFARHAAAHVQPWLRRHRADVLLVELGVNDALPPRWPGTHKCLEGLVRAAHQEYHGYHRRFAAPAGTLGSPLEQSGDRTSLEGEGSPRPKHSGSRQLAIVFVDIPRMLGSSGKQLVSSSTAFNRTERSVCSWRRGGDWNQPSERYAKRVNGELVSVRYEYARDLKDVVLGAEFAHAQVASCYVR